MKRRRSDSHAISGAFVFLLLGLFALFATVMVLLGARAYRGTAERAGADNAARVAASYLRTMVRGHDETDSVRVARLRGIQREDEDTGALRTDPADVDAILLADGETVTRVFVWDGFLWEEWSDPGEDTGDIDWEDSEELFFDDDMPEEAPAEPGIDEELADASRMEAVCAAEAMEARLEGNLLVIRLCCGGHWTELTCALHAGTP